MLYHNILSICYQLVQQASPYFALRTLTKTEVNTFSLSPSPTANYKQSSLTNRNVCKVIQFLGTWKYMWCFSRLIYMLCYVAYSCTRQHKIIININVILFTCTRLDSHLQSSTFIEFKYSLIRG